MNKMNKLIIYLFLGTLFLVSCGKKTNLFSGKKEKLEIIDPSFEYLTSKAKFKFEHDGKKIPASANFRIKKDSIIWISVSPGLGLEVARVLIDRNNVQVLNKLEKKYHKYSFRELSDQYSFDFNFQLIQSVILGNLTEPYTDEKVEKVGSHFVYRSRKGQFVFENHIGTSTMKLEKVNVSDDSSKNTISVNYGNFVKVDKEVFPNDISAVINYESENKPNTEIDISYNKFSIEEIPLAFPFSVPSRYGQK